MKKSYIYIIFFELLMFIVLLLNSFDSSILRGYKIVPFLFILVLIFELMLGFEKSRYRYVKDTILSLIIFFIIFFCVYYLLGIIIGFARTENYLSWYGLVVFIIPSILTIILKEYLRWGILTKSSESKVLITLTTVLFILLDILTSTSLSLLTTFEDIFRFVALTILPSVSTNIFLSYTSLKMGYNPCTFYLLVTRLYGYLLPIIPNPNEYLASIINFILPILALILVHSNLQKEKDEELDRKYNKKRIFKYIFPLILVVILVYFVSGYFRYYAIVIASGSMSPTFDKGAVALIEQVKDNYDQIRVGDIIAYKIRDTIIVHRVINIEAVYDELYFYTKGDANNHEDDYKIPKENIVGIVKVTIPYLGYPTVWLSGL